MPRFTLGILILGSGYGLIYYGFQRITGGNNTLVQLIWPGKYKAVAKDSS